MDYKEARTELDQIAVRLQEDGLPPGASSEERQRHLWRQLREGDEALRSSQQDMLALRTQQASEMKEVENYVEHIRGLLEERESLTAEYERDNEQLRLDLEHIRLQQESQRKELEEMLTQEGLGEVGLSGPSEQVAYLLVERATLLERLESAERRLDTQSLTGSLREVHMQEELDQIRHTMEEGLRQEREVAQKTRDTMSKVHSEDLSRQCSDRQQLERDLDEASRRLAMAHLDIRRLTDELDAARRNQGMSGSELERTGQEVENLRKEVDKLKHCDMMAMQRAKEQNVRLEEEMQRAKEQNERLEEEIRVLRERVRSLDSEKRTLAEKVTREDLDGKAPGEKTPKELLDTPAEEQIHKRCVAAVEDARCQVRELQRRLQRQQEEQEELVERNEELEALLGETQNCSKEERLHQEGELEGLHRKIRSLEAELKKMAALDPALRDGETSRETDTLTQQQTRASSQERASLLEARLLEEKDWRKQLEQDLNAAQAALKKDKEALQVGERELKSLRMEVQSLQTQCQQGKTLIKSLTQVKGEKGLLEEKVAQLERAQSRLREELERERGGGRAQEQLQEGRAQAEQLRGQLERVASELSSLQEENHSLRDEMARERRQISDLQAQLSSLVQEKLQAQGEKERLGLEAQVERLGLEARVERLGLEARGERDMLGVDLQVSSEQTTRAGQEPDTHSGHSASSLSLADKTREDGLQQLSCVKLELSRVQATLQQERQLASQLQASLQAQITEALTRSKCQDSVLGQRTEEERQLKQDLQRAQSLFTSAERELRYEREKSLDLKKHNTLLEQEKLKLCAELRQTQARQAQAEQGSQGQAAETERLQQRLRELQLELARSGHSLTTNASLQEELQAERARVIAADKKVVELQQQLKTCQHQLRLEQARAGETSRLERDSRDMSDSLSALRARQQEEQLHRKLLEQREEDLQQQVRSLRGKEASLSRSSAELGSRCQQLEARLAVLEAELSQARDEQRESQRTALRLGGELGASQQERERLQEEIQQVITQLDTHIRKHNEKQSQHKIKLRKAKQIFLKATAQRDRTIQKLENDLALASSLSQKEKDWIRTVMEENEKLLVERRDLLGRMSEAEEVGSNGLRTASTVQHRVNVLEVENRQLQERTLKLSNEVGALERTLRNVQSFCSLEDVKKMYNSESLLNDSTLHKSTISLTSGACDPLGILDAICRMKASEHMVGGGRSAFSVPSSQPSELGYLNLTSPSVPPEPKDPEDGLGVGDEQIVLLMLAHSALSCTEILANTTCCESCPAGYHAGEKCLTKTNPRTHKCVRCVKGTFTAIINSIDRCLRCSECEGNQVKTQDCVYNNDAKCVCQDGYYQENPESLCKPCVDDCKGNVACVARCPTNTTPFTTQTENSSSTTSSKPSMSKADPNLSKMIPLVILLTLVVPGILIFIKIYLTTSRKACLRREKDLELSAKSLQCNGNPEITSMSVFQANQPCPVRTLTTQSRTEDLIHVTPLLPNPQVEIPRQESQPDRIPATVLYAIIKEVPLRRWKEFLRLLAVPERQMERVELEAGMVTGSLERQYLMLRLWSQQPAANLDHVYSALQYMELAGCAHQLQSSLDQMQWCTGAGRLVTQPVTSPQPHRIMETWVMKTEL